MSNETESQIWKCLPLEWTCQNDHNLGDGLGGIVTYKTKGDLWAYAVVGDFDKKADPTDYETFVTGFKDEQAAIDHAVKRAIDWLADGGD
jgi:hypothetical protein